MPGSLCRDTSKAVVPISSPLPELQLGPFDTGGHGNSAISKTGIDGAGVAFHARTARLVGSTAPSDATTVQRFSTQPRLEWWAGLPVLTSSQIVLRELQPADAPSLLSMLGVPEVQRHLSPGPTTLEEFQSFIVWVQRAREAGRYISFGVMPKGWESAIGVFQLWPLEPSFKTAEWGFALGRPFWGTGLFLECARLVAEFAFETLGVERLEGRASAENGRGNGALRKLGAMPEGILRKCFVCSGAYRDHVLWSILSEDWRRIKTGRDAVSVDQGDAALAGCHTLATARASARPPSV